ncbi:hypothetical protein [Oceanobacillus sojae]|uniref:hypothetical protein n=1 Tax=Oceanobacillus sojae TaxID=582851 RepID=UPI00098850A8|nr:hypothetical protein [Oceanobacillus sojae]MCT1903685.1 hypothetical protein [Oceanobacillus sojae]
MLFIQILLVVIILAGIVYLIFLRKRNKFDPSQSRRDPFEVILEASEMFENKENNASPIKFMRVMKYVKQETGMGFFELKRYIQNSTSPYQKLEDPEIVQHLKDMLQKPENEHNAVKYVQDYSGLSFEKSKNYIDKFKKELL